MTKDRLAALKAVSYHYYPTIVLCYSNTNSKMDNTTKNRRKTRMMMTRCMSTWTRPYLWRSSSTRRRTYETTLITYKSSLTKWKSYTAPSWPRQPQTIVSIARRTSSTTPHFAFSWHHNRISTTKTEVKDELEERMAEIKKTAQKVRQKLKGMHVLVRVLLLNFDHISWSAHLGHWGHIAFKHNFASNTPKPYQQKTHAHIFVTCISKKLTHKKHAYLKKSNGIAHWTRRVGLFATISWFED